MKRKRDLYHAIEKVDKAIAIYEKNDLILPTLLENRVFLYTSLGKWNQAKKYTDQTIAACRKANVPVPSSLIVNKEAVMIVIQNIDLVSTPGIREIF